MSHIFIRPIFISSGLMFTDVLDLTLNLDFRKPTMIKIIVSFTVNLYIGENGFQHLSHVIDFILFLHCTAWSLLLYDGPTLQVYEPFAMETDQSTSGSTDESGRTGSETGTASGTPDENSDSGTTETGSENSGTEDGIFIIIIISFTTSSSRTNNCSNNSGSNNNLKYVLCKMSWKVFSCLCTCDLPAEIILVFFFHLIFVLI